jgi:HD-GYP domain-containing protein (c-di-GMP phosphodiesterase class II)
VITQYVRIDTTNLRLGMFIADLDRPWLDTPFLIQGFLLEDEEDLRTLQRLCQHVVIDLRRSTIDLSSLKQQLASPSQTLEQLLASPSQTQRGLIERDGPFTEQPFASPGVTLTAYVDEVPFEQELPRASEAYGRTKEALAELVHDVLTGSDLHIDQVDDVVDDMVESMISNPDAMMWVSRLRKDDIKTYAHGIRVSVYLLALGRHLGFPTLELHQLGMAGLLLDLGNINTPRQLLEKRGKLTPEEFEVVKRHVDYGLEMLSGLPKLHSNILEGVAQHHERLNGRGYPKGLKGDEIGIFGRMAGITDSFAALTSPRPYDSTVSPSDALSKLYEASGEYFHRPLIEFFVRAIGAFPVGSLVELSTGEVAVVVRHNRVRRLQPTVLLITDPSKQPLDRPMGFDLLYQQSIGRDTPVRIRCGLPVDAYGIDTSGYYIGQALVERPSSPPLR